MPLVLFTAVDNNGLTNLIAGCLLSNEKFESYQWTLRKFQVSDVQRLELKLRLKSKV